MMTFMSETSPHFHMHLVPRMPTLPEDCNGGFSVFGLQDRAKSPGLGAEAVTEGDVRRVLDALKADLEKDPPLALPLAPSLAPTLATAAGTETEEAETKAEDEKAAEAEAEAEGGAITGRPLRIADSQDPLRAPLPLPLPLTMALPLAMGLSLSLGWVLAKASKGGR